MKKKILVMVLALMLVVTGVVSAAANWGQFKGYNIVRLVIDGKTINAKDTPPVILEGRTMVPIAMLEEAGLTATWNKDTYTVVVTSKDEFVTEKEFIELNKVMQSHKAFIIFSDQIELTSITKGLFDIFTNESQFNQAVAQAERIDIDGLYGWAETLYALGVKEYSQFLEIAEIVENAKMYMYDADLSSAQSEIISARTKMNSLYWSLDDKYFDTFGEKNKERFK